MNILEDLRARGLVADCTDWDGLSARLSQKPIALYSASNPGDSLHVGHLMGQFPCAGSNSRHHHPSS
jgi:tyrosyl-tRNA synthetase